MDKLSLVSLGTVLAYIISYGWLLNQSIAKYYREDAKFWLSLCVFIVINLGIYYIAGLDVVRYLFSVFSIFFIFVYGMLFTRLWYLNKFK